MDGASKLDWSAKAKMRLHVYCLLACFCIRTCHGFACPDGIHSFYRLFVKRKTMFHSQENLQDSVLSVSTEKKTCFDFMPRMTGTVNAVAK